VCVCRHGFEWGWTEVLGVEMDEQIVEGLHKWRWGV